MEDIKEACVLNSGFVNNIEANSGFARDFVEDMNYYIKEISDLVIKARLQAKETDIRAKYAHEFANRAVAEASSAHQVSEALAKTSRMVAALALEFSNNTGEYIDEFIDSFNTSEDSLNTSFLNEDSSMDYAKDDSSLTETPGSNILVLSTSDQSKVINESVSNELETSSENVQPKYQTTYPDTLPKEELPKESDLSTVWEDSESSENNLVCDSTDESIDNDLKDEHANDAANDDNDDDEKDLETKRKMLIYRDSKIALSKMTPATTGLDLAPQNLPSAEIPPEVTCM